MTLTHELRQIAEAATRLANKLPYSLMIHLAEIVTRTGQLDHTARRHVILQMIPTPDFRDSTANFIENWFTISTTISADAVAAALLTAAKSEQIHQHEESVEVVWTGPEPAETRFRQTEQAILEVINSATKRLTVVSFAVYRIPRIGEALIAAVDRGVNIRMIIETPNRITGQGEYDCLLALGERVASACSVYYWPQENRGSDANGKYGKLHVKCAVSDGHRMFLSSANFTEHAFTINMELGLLVTGGELPGRVESHFDRLVTAGSLKAI